MTKQYKNTAFFPGSQTLDHKCIYIECKEVIKNEIHRKCYYCSKYEVKKDGKNKFQTFVSSAKSRRRNNKY